AGEGVVALGEEILRANRCREAWLLLSHYHPDHVAGLGRLPLLRQEGFTLRILGPADPDESLPKRLRDALEKSFAADRRPIAAKITIHELKEDAYDLAPGVKLNAFFLNHPSTTLGYLLHLGGKRLAYCPDAELYGDQATALQDYDERTARACRGVDLLVHDARWLGKDRAAHKDEGHSDAPSTGAFAAECEAARLWLFHADPGYSAEELSALEAEAKAALEEKGFHIPCQVAKDGLEVSF
ncbi:MAG TPA: MBL fold metallo-hydrolase, partial [Elusimicrobiota bacterium]|nr:MBL fold metallo-hydrolase [Elusimicrobiota bacterium]